MQSAARANRVLVEEQEKPAIRSLQARPRACEEEPHRPPSGVLPVSRADDDKHWHLDKKVPLALILTIVIQTVGIVWWAATTSERVTTLERRVDATAPQGDRLTRVEVKIEAVQEGISEIKRMIRRDPS